MSCIMMMAGGTGGHVMPALAVADKLRDAGIDVVWMGTKQGIEAQLVADAGYELESIRIRGLRGSGLMRKLVMPFMLLYAGLQSLVVILRRRPLGVIGMGGFVSGPGGALAVLLRLPLVIHEQNAIAGMTNRWLSRWSRRVLTGFPETLGFSNKYTWVGNPVRQEIADITEPQVRLAEAGDVLKVLVIGGSQGAEVFNQELPELLGRKSYLQIEVWHQCGQGRIAGIGDRYVKAGISSQVNEFIDDMAQAYAWCDVVICRAGAMTVAEVCAAGCVALFVPYPYAVNDHQVANAQYLVLRGAALMVHQAEFSEGGWLKQLARLNDNRQRLLRIAVAARKLAKPDAAAQAAFICRQVMHA